MAAPPMIVDELASTELSAAPSAAPEAPASDGTICPAMLHIVAPQPKRPITFGTGGLAEHAFVPPAGAGNPEPIEPDTDLAAGVDIMAISKPTITGSRLPRADAVSVQKPAKPDVFHPPPPPRPTRSYSTRSLSSPFGRPKKTRTERGKRTPQACERCRYRKTKVRAPS